jgi:hypothetical protein
MNSGFLKKAPRGKGFVKGDPRIQPKKKQENAFPKTDVDLRAMANEIGNTKHETKEGEILEWQAFLMGIFEAGKKGNVPAAVMFMTIAGKDKYLQQGQYDNNQKENVLVIGFKQPEDVIELEESPE